MTTDNTDRVWIAVYESYEDDAEEQADLDAYVEMVAAGLRENGEIWDDGDRIFSLAVFDLED